MFDCDFSGWATKNDMRCADGRVIRKGAFSSNDGEKVPLVWNHQHNDPFNFLGHAILENRNEGVYAYCTFNDSESGKQAKELVRHGDVLSLSIFANRLQENKMTGDVYHGEIKEVSLVPAGANPGARIETVMLHADNDDESAYIFIGSDDVELTLAHADNGRKEPKMARNENFDTNEKQTKTKQEQDDTDDKRTDSEETIGQIIDTMTPKQKDAMYALIALAIEDEEGDDEVKHNIFENEYEDNTLMHADMGEIIADAKRYGSLSESVLAHGIDGIEWLFPEAKNLNNPPEWITRRMDWVSSVMNGVHHSPFARIKSMYADLTADEARAKGYIKGKYKKEQVFTLLKRSTTPTTIYKKQKLDRDDIIDITDFDVVAWLKGEMRFMLDEEIARAILVGDGRNSSSDDKINEQNIRPIWTDEDLYTIKATFEAPSGATEDDIAKAFIRQCIKARKDYRGSGEPTLFCSEDIITACLLLEDKVGRVIYDSQEKLRTTLRVSNIVTVPVMENLTREGSDELSGKTLHLLGLIVNLNDYNVGADKGGAVNMFDDFDIDYNAQKYLIETRCSGALVKPYGAIAVEYYAAE